MVNDEIIERINKVLGTGRDIRYTMLDVILGELCDKAEELEKLKAEVRNSGK